MRVQRGFYFDTVPHMFLRAPPFHFSVLEFKKNVGGGEGGGAPPQLQPTLPVATNQYQVASQAIRWAHASTWFIFWTTNENMCHIIYNISVIAGMCASFLGLAQQMPPFLSCRFRLTFQHLVLPCNNPNIIICDSSYLLYIYSGVLL